jgi:OOP family OmpA-OmpF porin
MGDDINTAYSDGAPAISADGTELYFYSNRPGGTGLNDLYVMKRTKISG